MTMICHDLISGILLLLLLLLLSLVVVVVVVMHTHYSVEPGLRRASNCYYNQGTGAVLTLVSSNGYNLAK